MHLVMVYISLFSHPFIPPTIQPAKNQHGFSTVSALTQKSNTHFYTQWPLHTHIRVWNVTQTQIYIGHLIIPNTQAKPCSHTGYITFTQHNHNIYLLFHMSPKYEAVLYSWVISPDVKMVTPMTYYLSKWQTENDLA